MDLPIRKRMYHSVPSWVHSSASYFLTINASHRGTNTLAHPAIAEGIKEAIVFYAEKGKWHPKQAVIMPDHLHLIASLNTAEYSIPAIITLWKRYLSRKLKIVWQDGFFEHRLRNKESIDEKIGYVVKNPVRADLVKAANTWPYSWNENDFKAQS
ncbi:MAG: hypothetical protein AAF212_02955 [Verrucomicrobiota bacterium]